MSTVPWSTTVSNPSRKSKKRVATRDAYSDITRTGTTPLQSRHFSQQPDRVVPIFRRPLDRHDNEVDELEDHVVMAFEMVPNGRIGCAYYVAHQELLYCMQDIERGEQEIFETLKLEVEPTVVIFSPRLDDFASAAARRESSLVSDETDHRPLPYEIVVRPASDFKYQNAINKLGSLNTLDELDCIRFLIPGDNIDYNETQDADELGLVDQPGKMLTTTSSLNMDSKISMGCVGAVVGYLQRKRASEYLQHDPQAEAAYRISGLKMFTMKDTMLLNADALSSLQIIQSENHPNIANQGPSASGSKESLSIFGLFRRFARTPQGKARLRQAFLRPSRDRAVILKRQDFVSILGRPSNQSICDMLSKSLGRIKNMRTTLVSLRKGVERENRNSGTIRSGVWAALLEFCFHCIDIVDVSKELDGAHDLERLITTDTILDKLKLQQIGKMIHDIVDLDKSLEEHRTVIRRGINHDLDAIKDAYDSMEDVLAKVATEITNHLPAEIDQMLNVVFMPQLGFHVTVPLDEDTNEPIWNGDETWERRFRTSKHLYFKNNKMRDMDERWGDLHAVICDTEIEISHELAQQVLENGTWLIQASDYCGELDFLLALTHGAVEYKLTRPKIVEDNVIDIDGGRHILQEMTVATYITNDTHLAGGDECGMGLRHSMLLLTGPNFSGKSVYMKQVALIVYMAQVGSFVPAESATLGLTDTILTRINTAETVSKVQSAFVIDLQQISGALKSCTSRSLVLIDEFGKGTDNCDGAGLASGVLRYLLSLDTKSPKVLASTHFHEIFENGAFDVYQNLKFAHMAVLLNSRRGDQTNSVSEIVYLYNLCDGRSNLSYGNQCASLNGIPLKVVDRAMLLADMVIDGEDLVATCAALPEAELEELEDAEAICRFFLNHDLSDESMDIHNLLEQCKSDGLPVNMTESARSTSV